VGCSFGPVCREDGRRSTSPSASEDGRSSSCSSALQLPEQKGENPIPHQQPPTLFHGNKSVARFIGAHGWMFIASERSKEHRLINASNGYGSICLRDRIASGDGAHIIRAATLLSPPVVASPEPYVVTSPHPRSTYAADYIIFWRKGSALAPGVFLA